MGGLCRSKSLRSQSQPQLHWSDWQSEDSGYAAVVVEDNQGSVAGRIQEISQTDYFKDLTTTIVQGLYHRPDH